MEAFENIQMHRLFKQKMEMFILLFNQDPERGINFLIGNELIDDTPEKIAEILVTTEGLSKDMIGKYLGSHKEKHIKVLKAYCNSLDFSHLKFDHALRLLLSRFKLPGEAWQIERVVQMFAEVYHKDNPDAFVDADTPYILSYSLLMLNTDAHSDNIPKNRKMTRTQFVTNNLKVCKGITAEYLGMMYDNIIKSKFETRTDYIEQMYSRLQLDSNKLLLQGETIKMAMDTVNELIKGAVFIKYGRMGKPHERHICLSAAEDRVLWKKPSKSDSSAKSIFLYDITNVYVGSSSTKVLRQKKVPFELDNVIFSLETSKRTLDLRAPDLKTRTKWEGYFRQQLLHRKQKEDEIALKMKDRSSKDRERISEIWKTDILPNFHYHWNYESHRPHNQDDLEHSKNRNSNGPKLYRAAAPKKRCSWKTLLCCLWLKSDSKSHFPLNSSQIKSSRMRIEEGATEQNELGLICQNKSILLYHVWRLGIPDWLRKTIWPITIGNRLEITPNLYQVLLSAAEAFKGDEEKFKNITEYRAVMERDIPETFWELECFKEPRNRQALTNVLVAFICYRPDVGYVKGMAHMAAVLVRYCPEYEAFECFVNMTHSYHFISFFRGEMRDVEWRIEMFNQYFKKELPQLYNHFSALDISSEMFLLDWFLSLFSAGLTDLDIIARIWDCFLLDGELFAIKTAVAILKYYELELRMIGFAAATQFLKKPLQIINEKQFFDIIESLNIPSMEYQKTLEKKTVAQINSHIHQALLIS